MVNLRSGCIKYNDTFIGRQRGKAMGKNFAHHFRFSYNSYKTRIKQVFALKRIDNIFMICG